MIRILHNGRVYPHALASVPDQAIAICGDRVLATGSNVDILNAYGKKAQLSDLGGQTVLPGFTDAHIHLQHYAGNLKRINAETGTLAECLQAILKTQKTSAGIDWLLGHGWNQNTWGGRFPDRHDLDPVSAGQPAYLTAKSLHAGWCNTKALELAGISRGTPDPEGGRIQRDVSGEPTGILFEAAMQMVERLIPDPDDTARSNDFQAAQAELNRLGITGIHDFDGLDCFRTLQRLLNDDCLHLRVVKNIPYPDLNRIINSGISGGFGHPLLRFGAVKLFADGALGPGTAAMLASYESSPGDTGMLLLSEEEILEAGRKAAGNSLPLAIHAIGDRAVRTVLNALIRLQEQVDRNQFPAARHRIEHLQLIAPSDLELLRGSGIIASMQPYHMVSDLDIAQRHWGLRSEYSYAWGSVAETGTVLAFGSDAPVESPNPFSGLHAAVTRKPADYPEKDGWYPRQKLSLRQAIRAYTTGPAYASGQEMQLGKLEAGYFADLIVLDKDPFIIPHDELPRLVSSATMVSGQWTWNEV